MATPMTASQIKAQLRKWNVPFREYRSWETHNRGNRGTGWGPVNGFMVHHTGSDSTDQRALLYNGFSTLPGPLCHFGLAQDGTVWLIGWGRANHAGSGDPDVLRAVINENYGDYPPRDNESSVDFNSRFYGVEIWYSGSHSMTDAQYRTLRKLASAVLDFHGWSEKSVIGHGESGSPGKWDPGIRPGTMMDMSEVRDDVKSTLNGGPNSNDNSNSEDDVTPEDIDKIADKVADKLLNSDRIEVPWESENTHNQVENALASMWRQTYRTEHKLEELSAKVDALDLAGFVAALENLDISINVQE